MAKINAIYLNKVSHQAGWHGDQCSVRNYLVGLQRDACFLACTQVLLNVWGIPWKKKGKNTVKNEISIRNVFLKYLKSHKSNLSLFVSSITFVNFFNIRIILQQSTLWSFYQGNSLTFCKKEGVDWHDILESQNYRDGEKISGCQGTGWDGGGVTLVRQHDGALRWWGHSTW